MPGSRPVRWIHSHGAVVLRPLFRVLRVDRQLRHLPIDFQDSETHPAEVGDAVTTCLFDEFVVAHAFELEGFLDDGSVTYEDDWEPFERYRCQVVP